MNRHLALVLASLAGVSLVLPLLASRAAPQDALPAQRAQLVWGDVDGDAQLDLLVLQPDGGLQLWLHADGTFVDATVRLGLADGPPAACAAFGDADGDGRADLFLGTRAGGSRLYVQAAEGGFVDVTEASGLAPRVAAREARWIDLDGDGAAELWLTTPWDDLLYRNDGAGRFERLDLGLPVAVADAAPIVAGPGGPAGIAPGGAGGGDTLMPPPSAEVICAIGVVDQANPPTCLQASTTPVLGDLYPISTELFVDAASGNVGLGTTTPGTRLEVAGDASVSGALISTRATGAPLQVASADLVTNLNADLLDGQDSSAFALLPITGADVLDGSLTAADLGPDAVDGATVLDGSLTAADLAVGSVTSAQVLDASLTAADLGPDAVDGATVLDGSLTDADLAVGSVTSAQVLDGSLTAVDLGVGSVDSAAVADGSLLAADLATGSVGSAQVLDDSLTALDLAPNSVTSSEIFNGTIRDADVSGAAAIQGVKIDPDFGDQDVMSSGMATFQGGGGTAALVAGQFNGANTNGMNAFTSTADADAVQGTNFNSMGTTSNGVRAITASATSDAVFAQGGYGGTGAKYFIQPHPTDPLKEVRMVCLEGNEHGTYFRGTTRTVDGRAVIEVPEVFRLVSSDEGLTVQTTAVGAPARLWIESQDLERIVVRSDRDVELHYFVNGLRRGYEDLGQRLVRENVGYVPMPEELDRPYGTQYPDALRRILVQNGILNPDFTPNRETVQRMWAELEGARARVERSVSQEDR